MNLMPFTVCLDIYVSYSLLFDHFPAIGLIDASDTLTVEEQTAQSEAMGDWSRALNGYCEVPIFAFLSSL